MIVCVGDRIDGCSKTVQRCILCVDMGKEGGWGGGISMIERTGGVGRW